MGLRGMVPGLPDARVLQFLVYRQAIEQLATTDGQRAFVVTVSKRLPTPTFSSICRPHAEGGCTLLLLLLRVWQGRTDVPVLGPLELAPGEVWLTVAYWSSDGTQGHTRFAIWGRLLRRVRTWL